MRPAEFLRAVKKLGRRRGLKVVLVPGQGKGSHGTLYLGDRRTILKSHGDIGKGLLHGMCSDLGIETSDL